MQFVAAAFQPDKPRTINGLGKRDAMLDRKDRIGRAVNDEQRRSHILQAVLPLVAASRKDREAIEDRLLAVDGDGRLAGWYAQLTGAPPR